MPQLDAETQRIAEGAERTRNWQRWGTYLPERQWATVREDYSPFGAVWSYFPHDQARSRAYRWGEDGLLGWTDRECRLCFGLALWNGKDPILKERLYGLTHDEGNHGEDVKEYYYYLDATPTNAYARALYKYPQAEFPYARLIQENQRRGYNDREFELLDTGVFNEARYFDVFVEYAKGNANDTLIRITAVNHGPESAPLWLLPTLWFRNTWIWGCKHEGCWRKPRLSLNAEGEIVTQHEALEPFRFAANAASDGTAPQWLFTENETNTERLFKTAQYTPYVKDAFHRYVVNGEAAAVNPKPYGTKAAAMYKCEIAAGEKVTLTLRLCSEAEAPRERFGGDFTLTFSQRMQEADLFYAARLGEGLSPEQALIKRQAYAGLLWTKQFYHYIVADWLDGDPEQPPPPPERKNGRNHEWRHVYINNVLSMPDKWEYPWFAAWDMAFHMVLMAEIDAPFAKNQLELMLREWFMHPNGQIPAYEFAFSDVNPPVWAYACWRVYKIADDRGSRDRGFLRSVFHKLLINFTWWVNRKDPEGRNIFSGGFLGLDNIGVFDRSRSLPPGYELAQADGTAWMAFYCITMLAIAIELAADDSTYEDIASKFFEHFIAISDAMNELGGTGLWHQEDGFYYDVLMANGQETPLRVRSMVGLIPLFAVTVLDQDVIDKLPGFTKRMDWFIKYRPDLAQHVSYMETKEKDGKTSSKRLLGIPSRERLECVLKRLFDENEFLSNYGVRSLSKYHAEHPFVIDFDGMHSDVSYAPAEAKTGLFGGNSNWRGPIWVPVNFLLCEALERFHHFYGEDFKIEVPTGSGCMMTLAEASRELARRLQSMFMLDGAGRRPLNGEETVYQTDAAWRDLVLFYEYFDAETGRGCGASHQTGWTALIARWIERATPGAKPQEQNKPMIREKQDGH